MDKVSVNRFLIIDDSDGFRAAMRAFVKKFYPESIFDEHEIKSKGDIKDDFDWSRYDVLFLDYDLGDSGNGLDWYKRHKSNSNFPATIMLTGIGNEQVAVKAIKTGIHEYLSKEALSRKRLTQSINNAIEAKAEEIEKELSMTQFGTTFNKSIFFSRLENANTVKEEENTVLVLILLDAHEVIGKTWGLLVRDKIIRHITKEVNQYLRPAYPDLNITRYGDQYVAVLLGDAMNSKNLEDNLAGLCQQFQDTVYKEGKSDVNFTVSVGAVPLKGINLSASEIISLGLDTCHTEQKTAGNSFVVHTTELIEQEKDVVQHKSTEKFEVVTAIKEGRIVPRFQQIVSLAEEAEKTGDDIYEVRVRFLQTDGELLGDDDFKNIIQDEKVLQSVDKWMVRMAVGKLLRMEDLSTSKAKYVIKLTGYSLANSKFMFWIMDLLKKNKFRKTSLLIEINADDFLKHTKPISGLMSYLRNVYNFEFILSPVGDPELFNLVFTKEKFEYIKLHTDLTQHVVDDIDVSRKVDTIINMAHKAKVKVIATWIENTGVLYAAHDKKVDLIQGNFVSPPREDVEDID